MSDFKRYKSIENHYREKYINDMIKFNPVYAGCKYVVTEKIDGGNFQVRLTTPETGRGVKIEYGKRTSILAKDEDFYNYKSVINDLDFTRFLYKAGIFFDGLSFTETGEPISEIIFYGEIFGPGIQSRIDYGNKKKILFYDIAINGEYMSQMVFVEIMSEVLSSPKLMVPIIGIYDSFEQAFAVEVEGVKTYVNPDGDNNLWEGVVIKPYDAIAVNKNGEQVLFYVKKKTDKFKDQMKVKSKNKRKDIPVEVTNAQAIFESYLTDNRLMDIFGKNGTIERVDQIGEYVKMMMDDAKTDFFKDNMEEFMKIPDKYKNMVFTSSGKIVSKMLFRYV